MNAFEWTQASSVDQAISSRTDGSIFKAGGVDILDLLKERVSAPARIINLRLIHALDFIEDEPGGGIRIGPLVKMATVAQDPKVRSKWSIFAEAVGHAATPQVRNMASIGGSLLQRPRCWYFRSEQFNCRRKGGDTCFAQDGENQYHAIFNNDDCAIIHASSAATPLVAFGGSVVLKGAKGEREVPAEKFFVLPDVDIHRENVLASDEILTAIRLPAPAAGTVQAYQRTGEMQSHDWPLCEIAVILERDGDVCRKASIVLGAAAPAPHRAKEAEAMLAGKTITESLAREAARAAMKSATPLSQNAYKVSIFEAQIRRTILAAAGSNNEGGVK